MESLRQCCKRIRMKCSRRCLLNIGERYGTRITLVLVWYGVMWSILGYDAFPKEFIPIRRLSNQTDDVSAFEDRNASLCAWNSSWFLGSVYGFNDNMSCNDSQLVASEDNQGLLVIPDGHFFALFMLLVISALFGFFFKLLKLPPLTGMLIAGCILRNVPSVNFAADISRKWSSTIRNITLVVVLIRGGLSLNTQQLKRLKLAVFLLALLPCICEGAIDGGVATFFIPLPWKWGLMMGYVVAAISPAVVIPTMLQLQRRHFGTEKGIPTLIVAAASVDVVTAVSLFGIFLGLVFSDGSLVLDIFRAPIQISVGLIFGAGFGFLLWIFPTRKNPGSKLRNRFFLLLGFGLFGLFGSRRAIIGGSSLAGAGALSVLVLAFVAGLGWQETEKKMVNRAFFITWQFLEPLLFGLIGAEVNIEFINASLIGRGIVVITCGLIVRVIISIVVVSGNGFNLMERIFIGAAWVPKATVQAAIGSFALDIAVDRNFGEGAESLGRKVLTIAVLSIILTAPAGAVAIAVLGPLLLQKSSGESNVSDGDTLCEHVENTTNGLSSPKQKTCIHRETTV